MSYQICIDPDVNCVFVKYFDFVQGEGLAAIDYAVQSPLFKPGMCFLRDTQKIDLPDYLDYDWFKKDFEEIYGEHHLLLQGSKFAWVVGTPADYAKVHSWALVTRTTRGQNRMAFRELRLALNWLEIPSGYEIAYQPVE